VMLPETPCMLAGHFEFANSHRGRAPACPTVSKGVSWLDKSRVVLEKSPSARVIFLIY
jgi:hypothetical protein